MKNSFGKTAIAAQTIIMRGRRLRMPPGSPCQLGGAVPIDSQRIERLHHIGRGPIDRPSVKSILKIVRDVDRPN